MVKNHRWSAVIDDDSQVLELKLDQNKRLSKEENSKELFKKELVMFGWGSNDYGQLGCGTGKIIKMISQPLILRVLPLTVAPGDPNSDRRVAV